MPPMSICNWRHRSPATCRYCWKPRRSAPTSASASPCSWVIRNKLSLSGMRPVKSCWTLSCPGRLSESASRYLSRSRLGSWVWAPTTAPWASHCISRRSGGRTKPDPQTVRMPEHTGMGHSMAWLGRSRRGTRLAQNDQCTVVAIVKARQMLQRTRGQSFLNRGMLHRQIHQKIGEACKALVQCTGAVELGLAVAHITVETDPRIVEKDFLVLFDVVLDPLRSSQIVRALAG